MLNERISKIALLARTRFATMTAVVLVSLASLLIGACAPQHDGAAADGPAKASGDVNDFSHLSGEEKILVSEAFADEAEQKLGFVTLNEAWGKFSEALQLNPNNHRATFWKEILKPMFESKGLLARVRPLYLKQENGQERYRELIQKTRGSSSPEYFKFLTDGPADIDSDDRFRDLMDRVIVSLDTLRTFLKANRDRDYLLRAPVKFLTGPQRIEKGNRCAALKIMNSKFAGCPESGMLNFKVNRADIEMMQGIVAYEMLYLSVLNAFNFNPVALVLNVGGLSNKAFVTQITTGYSGGLLERNHLNVANSMAADWLVAHRFFTQNQKELCKNGANADDNRPGFLISQGFCLSDKPGSPDARTLDMLETMLQGRPVALDMKFAEQRISVYPLKFFTTPPKEAMPLAPTDYDADGTATAFNEAPYSPYFAEGSINSVMRADMLESYFDHIIDRSAKEEFEKNFPESAKNVRGRK